MGPLSPLVSKLEALLFAAGHPLTARQLAKQITAKPKEVEEALQQLTQRYQTEQSGLALLVQDERYQLTTNPTHGKLIEQYIKDEFTGPLSRAALETLAIIAYRGPILKPEIDTVRGVNSAIMLRALLIRGLVERKRSSKDARSYEYSLSFDFMRHLGVSRVTELPQYQELHNNEVMERFAKAVPGASIESTES
ncbi:MAG: SMC-Scp complex subunit ScpB [Parcubacteria group bacterium]